MLELVTAVAELLRDAGVRCSVLQFGPWGWRDDYHEADPFHAHAARLRVFNDPGSFTVTFESNYSGQQAVWFDPADPELITEITAVADDKRLEALKELSWSKPCWS